MIDFFLKISPSIRKVWGQIEGLTSYGGQVEEEPERSGLLRSREANPELQTQRLTQGGFILGAEYRDRGRVRVGERDGAECSDVFGEGAVLQVPRPE